MPARGRPQLIEADDAPAPALLEDLALGHRAAQAGPDDLFDNRLIRGDNLAVLRALGPEFAGRVQCVYIDPPYNTGQVFAHYDDGLEHDRWLALMRRRLLLLHRLLTDSGTLFVHIDDNELAYLITVADEVFGRDNRIAVITFKQSSVSGPKAVNAGFVSTASFIVVYARRRAAWRPGRVHAATARDARYTRWIDNIDDPPERWRLVPLRQAFARARGLDPKSLRAAPARPRSRHSCWGRRTGSSAPRGSPPATSASRRGRSWPARPPSPGWSCAPSDLAARTCTSSAASS
ncbi:DNA methyltransferase [Nannocystis pusilla]|uniref:DNA methyltransferase n=1 Tax=Nannocystis pusilla TaxID=889268 RepID=UPI003B7D6B51